jgi:hypothetical protein
MLDGRMGRRRGGGHGGARKREEQEAECTLLRVSGCVCMEGRKGREGKGREGKDVPTPAAHSQRGQKATLPALPAPESGLPGGLPRPPPHPTPLPSPSQAGRQASVPVGGWLVGKEGR